MANLYNIKVDLSPDADAISKQGSPYLQRAQPWQLVDSLDGSTDRHAARRARDTYYCTTDLLEQPTFSPHTGTSSLTPASTSTLGRAQHSPTAHAHVQPSDRSPVMGDNAVRRLPSHTSSEADDEDQEALLRKIRPVEMDPVGQQHASASLAIDSGGPSGTFSRAEQMLSLLRQSEMSVRAASQSSVSSPTPPESALWTQRASRTAASPAVEVGKSSTSLALGKPEDRSGPVSSEPHIESLQCHACRKSLRLMLVDPYAHNVFFCPSCGARQR